MKKRKVKLFASIASLAMVVAVMGVGVWAATQQSVGINTTVGFTATSIAGEVAFKVDDGATDNATGDILKSASLSKAGDYAHKDAAGQDIAFAFDAAVATDAVLGASQKIADFAQTDSQSNFNYDLKLTLEDKDDDGFINKDATITFTFDITAETNMTWNLTLPTIATEYQDVFSVDFGQGTDQTGTITIEEGDTTASKTLTIVYTVLKNHAETIVDTTSLGKVVLSLNKVS